MKKKPSSSLIVLNSDFITKVISELGNENFTFIINEKFKIPRIDIWNNDDLNTFRRKEEGRWNWMKFFSKY